jgi:histidinol phosphatase-like PHP family hydrolase
MPSNSGADPRDVLADLHSHSMISDGTLRPAELVARAHEQGVELFALTDHDEVDLRSRGRSLGHLGQHDDSRHRARHRPP